MQRAADKAKKGIYTQCCHSIHTAAVDISQQTEGTPRLEPDPLQLCAASPLPHQNACVHNKPHQKVGGGPHQKVSDA